jgi:GTP 3',8-cyclase
VTGAAAPGAGPALIDRFGRAIDYLRLSITDRCDLRCAYCLGPHPRFAPRKEQLSLEELDRLAAAFVSLGVRRLRITGGEPLVRRGALELLGRLGRHLATGALAELTLTTNGTLLAPAAAALARAGVRRVNVSLDGLDPRTYRRITGGGRVEAPLAGIEAARAAGLSVKVNAVALRGAGEQDLPGLVRWAHSRGVAVRLIELMPLGSAGADHPARYVSLASVRQELERSFTLVPEASTSPGPARSFRVLETGGSLGFIAPLSRCFCEGCNRVRVTASGALFPCLGHDLFTDLRGPLRSAADDQPLRRAIQEAIARKPARHAFSPGGARAPARAMSLTGG